MPKFSLTQASGDRPGVANPHPGTTLTELELEQEAAARAHQAVRDSINELRGTIAAKIFNVTADAVLLRKVGFVAKILGEQVLDNGLIGSTLAGGEEAAIARIHDAERAALAALRQARSVGPTLRMQDADP